MGFRGLGFGGLGVSFRVWGLGFRAQGSGFRVESLGFRVQGLRFRVEGVGVQGLGFRASTGGGRGCRMLGFRVSGFLGYCQVFAAMSSGFSRFVFPRAFCEVYARPAESFN